MLRAIEAATRLDPAEYERLRSQILHRDGWRCQFCGAMSNLEVHHQIFRSQGGSDSKQNLITLCSNCHARIHRSEPRSGTRPGSSRML